MCEGVTDVMKCLEQGVNTPKYALLVGLLENPQNGENGNKTKLMIMGVKILS